MPLVLRLREPSRIPLEVDAIRFDAVRSLAPEAVARLLIPRGNRSVAVGEFFDVRGSAEDDTIIWQGDLSKVKRIGAELDRGRIVVEGDAGMHLGAEMTGGEIEVRGNVGDWAGAEMKGGLLRIHGHAGNLVGGAYRGSPRGMTGGEILIDGNAGHEVARTMRRGLVAIAGDVGDVIGSQMISGTVLVLGRCGLRHGAGMKRGTIALLGPEAPELLPTFRHACDAGAVFLDLYRTRLAALKWGAAGRLALSGVRRFRGDLVGRGQGEILTRRLSS